MWIFVRNEKLSLIWQQKRPNFPHTNQKRFYTIGKLVLCTVFWRPRVIERTKNKGVRDVCITQCQLKEGDYCWIAIDLSRFWRFVVQLWSKNALISQISIVVWIISLKSLKNKLSFAGRGFLKHSCVFSLHSFLCRKGGNSTDFLRVIRVSRGRREQMKHGFPGLW